jgi:hypothetical protein
VFQPHPWPRVQQRKHTSSSPQVQPLHRRSLRDGVNAYLRALPGVRDLIVTVACRSSSANLAPAQGRQDHTISPSAIVSHVRRYDRVHRIPRPTLVTIAKRPSRGGGMRRHNHDFQKNERTIFLREGLDTRLSIDSVRGFRFFAQGFRETQTPPRALRSRNRSLVGQISSSNIYGIARRCPSFVTAISRPDNCT